MYIILQPSNGPDTILATKLKGMQSLKKLQLLTVKHDDVVATFKLTCSLT